MALTAAGVGSGLDIENIISQLMQLERRPLFALQDKEDQYNAQLSAFGQLKGAISNFQSAMDALGSLDKFKVFSSTSSDVDVATASTDSEAAQGTFDLDISRLAQRHKIAGDAQADTDTFTGDLSITIGSDSFTINPAGLTLEEIRDAVNTASDNPGVTASVLNVGGNQQRLILTSDDEGYDERLQFSGSIATSLNLATINRDDADVLITDLTELDASFTVDGFAVTTASNNATGVVDGVTFELKKTGSTTIAIDRDTESITSAVNDFVSSYNSLQTTINSLRANALEADSTPLSVQNQIRNVLNTAPVGLTTSTFTSLSELGLTTDAKTGTLSLNSSTLEDALNTDFNNVAELFAHDDQGYAFRLEALAEDMLETDGLIDLREDGLNERISDNQDDQARVEYRLELKEQSLRAEFSALDGLLGSLQTTSNFLANALTTPTF